MNAEGIELLSNPHPHSHIIYPYTDEHLVAQAVCLFASSGLRSNEGVILIVKESHLKSIRQRIEAEGFDFSAFEETGQLVCMLAEDLLLRLMAGRELNVSLFYKTMGRAIARARRSTRSGLKDNVRIFGEMVSLLWAPNLTATIDLEKQWSDIVAKYNVSLLCTYDLLNTSRPALPQTPIAAHSHQLAA